jgi:hypothetical protein
MNSIQKHILEMKKLVIPHAPLGVKVAMDVHCYQPTEQFVHLVMYVEFDMIAKMKY